MRYKAKPSSSSKMPDDHHVCVCNVDSAYRKHRFSVKNSKSEFRTKYPDGDKYETMTEIKNVPMTKTFNFQWFRFGHFVIWYSNLFRISAIL